MTVSMSTTFADPRPSELSYRLWLCFGSALVLFGLLLGAFGSGSSGRSGGSGVTYWVSPRAGDVNDPCKYLV
ncbi:hypothetical protein ANO14919_012210 [Xylariales sp. No.14919]|nr:hypothetical protein ANO14919_012210 [Xylariales sp. No.14919]